MFTSDLINTLLKKHFLIRYVSLSWDIDLGQLIRRGLLKSFSCFDVNEINYRRTRGAPPLLSDDFWAVYKS